LNQKHIAFRNVGNRKYIIFGTGKKSADTIYSNFNISYYLDNDKSKWGTNYQDAPVFSPEKLLEEDMDQITVFIASMYEEEMSRQLEEYNLRHGVHFFRNVRSYLRQLASEICTGIEKFKNIHEGKRAFIIGNGPSLKIDDLDLLKNEITFASNNIHVAFSETAWRPTYYTLIDPLAARNKKDNIRAVPSIKLFPHQIYATLGEMEKCYWLNGVYAFNREGKIFIKSFPNDIADFVYYGGTVTFFNLQLAYYMGVKEIYLLGVDFKYNGIPIQEKDAWNYKHSGELRAHFHPNYFEVGEVLIRPDMMKHYECFSVASRFLNEQGVKVYNASRFSELDLFPRASFDQIVNDFN